MPERSGKQTAARQTHQHGHVIISGMKLNAVIFTDIQIGIEKLVIRLLRVELRRSSCVYFVKFCTSRDHFKAPVTVAL
jgi:hypothetical protein